MTPKEMHDLLQRAGRAAGLAPGDDLTKKLVPQIRRIVAAGKAAHHALDDLLGDTDLPDDDSPAFMACQLLSAALWPIDREEDHD